MKRILLLLPALSGAFAACAAPPADTGAIAEIERYSEAKTGGKLLYGNAFDRREECPAKLPAGYSFAAAQGRNGTGALLYQRSDAKKYTMLQFDPPPVADAQPCEAEVYVRGSVRRHGEDKNIGGLCIEYLKDGQWHSGYYYKLETLPGEWTKLRLAVTPVVGTQMVLKLYLRKGFTGEIYFDDLTFRTAGSPDSIVLNAPAMLRLDGGANPVRFSTSRTMPAGGRLLVTARDTAKNVRKVLLDGENHLYSGSLGPLTPGPVAIEVAAADPATKRILIRQKFLANAGRTASSPPGACAIDGSGRLLVEGKPFMPVGIYAFADAKTLQTVAEAGFNSVITYGSMQMHGGRRTGDRIRDVRAGLDLFSKYNIKCIFSLKDQYEHKKAAVRDANLAPDATALRLVSAVRNHPALLAWYVNDEEPRHTLPRVARLREKIAAADPDHPAWSLTYRYGDFPYYGISGDVMGIDPYPIDHKTKSISLVAEAMEAANQSRQPVWMVPQIFNWEVYRTRDPEVFRAGRFPTEGEIRAMVLLGAVHGAKGFVFYSYFDIRDRAEKLDPGAFAREWPKVKSVVALLKRLEPFIMSKKPPKPLAVQRAAGSGRVDAALFTADDGRRAVLISGVEPGADAIVRLPSGKFIAAAGPVTSAGADSWRFRSSGIDGAALIER